MRERKLERIALVVRIHDGRELVGEVLVEIFEQRANREQLTPYAPPLWLQHICL